MQSTHLETWKPVVGYERYYEVSDIGRVRSLGRRDTQGRWCPSRILKAAPRDSTDDHLRVRLSVDGRTISVYVHRLMLQSFVGPAPAGHEGCHRDDNPWNNTLGNLRWGTRSDNVLDRVRLGNHHATRRTHCPFGHVLRAPNLVTSPSVDGKRRQCLACKRARSIKRRPFTQELADEKYREIMSRT